MSDSYALMKIHPDIFPDRNIAVASTSRYEYQAWQSKLQTDGAGYWSKLTERFAEDSQFALLRAMTVVGISVYDWNDVFQDVYCEYAPFEGIIKQYLHGSSPAWTSFAGTLLGECTKTVHYPTLYPEWLFPYGYNQQLYLTDLALCWANIHADYYKLWDTTRLGEDSPEITRLRKIGQTARQEIDAVAQYGAQSIKR